MVYFSIAIGQYYSRYYIPVHDIIMSRVGTAEYETVLRCGDRIKQAVQSNLTDISDLMVEKLLISPGNGQELRNTHHSESDRASKFLELLRSAVKDDAQKYRIFVDNVLREDYFFYRGIIEHLNSEYDKIKGIANKS